MQDKKEIKNAILEKLSLELSAFGFDIKIRGQSFWKRIDGGRAMIHAHFIDHVLDFDVTISVSLRIDAVEDMINTSNKILSKSEGRMTSTVFGDLGNLSSGIQKRYSIMNPADIDDAVEQMIESIRSTALPFIEKYSDLETLLNCITEDDKSAWIIAPIDHRRAQSAVALAKLLKREDLENIIKSKRAFLEKRKDFGLRLFEEFVKTIEGHYV